MDVNGYCRESNGFLLAEAGLVGGRGRSLSEAKQLSFAIETNAVIDVDGNVTSLGMLTDGPRLEHKTAQL